MGGGCKNKNIRRLRSPAVEAVYHKACSSIIRMKKQVLVSFATGQLERKRGKRGRPQDEEQNAAFLKVTEFLQRNSEEQVTVQYLETKMKEYLWDSRSLAYSQTYMRTCLQKHFGDELVITFADGKPNVVTFRQTAAEKTRFTRWKNTPLVLRQRNLM